MESATLNAVRAKLSVSKVEKSEFGENITFWAQYSNTPEDNSFSKATPSASMQMFVSNPNVFGFFKEGQAYYFDITPAT